MQRMAQYALTLETDPELFPDRAGRAVAAHEIGGLDPFAAAAFEVDDRGGDAVAGVLEGFKPAAITQVDSRRRQCKVPQDRIEPHLRAGLQPHGTPGLRLEARHGRAGNAAELIAAEARHEYGVSGVIARERAVVHPVGDAPAPAELHGADIHFVHFRRDDSAVALLDQQARYAAPAKLAGER